MESSRFIFGNPIPEKVRRKAEKKKEKYLKKFGDDSAQDYRVSGVENACLHPFLGIHNVVIGEENAPLDSEKGVLIGNIRMGFGHYRIAMAIASAANAMGYKPYWFDLHAYDQTTGGKVIAHLNDLYSMGSRWSQKYPLFNKLYWEPLNSEGFRKLSFNASDQKVSELMTPIFKSLPKKMPFIATHVWPAQAAVHAGMQKVVNVIPDNWAMGLHLAQGSLHTVQSPSVFWAYKTLKGMDGKKILQPIPENEIVEVGHYIDHELVMHIESDCLKRITRICQNKPKRVLMTVGGAGAQKKYLIHLIEKLMPMIRKKEVTLFLNVGDHLNVLEEVLSALPELSTLTESYLDDWEKTCAFAERIKTEDVGGVHVFYHADIFKAVYSTNLLMRSTDLMITKPSELAFYPVPKLLIKRVGGHEAWGAIRAAEIGDGTVECDAIEEAAQMLTLILKNQDLHLMMVENIRKAHNAKIYHGAYRVVEAAFAK